MAILPLFSTLINGLIIGSLFYGIDATIKISNFETFLMLLPHGIFEIPSLVLALAMGIKLGAWPFKRNRVEFLKVNIRESSFSFLKIILPFLVIAALIETIGIETVYILK